jgi:hypothetical protein
MRVSFSMMGSSFSFQATTLAHDADRVAEESISSMKLTKPALG